MKCSRSPYSILRVWSFCKFEFMGLNIEYENFHIIFVPGLRERLPMTRQVLVYIRIFLYLGYERRKNRKASCSGGVFTLTRKKKVTHVNIEYLILYIRWNRNCVLLYWAGMQKRPNRPNRKKRSCGGVLTLSRKKKVTHANIRFYMARGAI
jgi:hypothetical protein